MTDRPDPKIGVDDLATLLRHDDTAYALPALRRLQAEGNPSERLGAAWALAGWEAGKGNWFKVHHILAPFRNLPEAVQLWPDAKPWLLAVQSLLIAGHPGAVPGFLAPAQRHFGAQACPDPMPDLALADLLCRAAGFADDWELATLLWRLHARCGVAALSLAAGEGARFDRLQALMAQPSQPVTAGPCVSVVLPLSGVAPRHHLAKALAGVLGQSWQNLELLVPGGAENADLRRWAAQDGRIRLLPAVAGPLRSAALNEALAQARGAFVTVQDENGWSHPARIETQLAMLLSDPQRMACRVSGVALGETLAAAQWQGGGWIGDWPDALMIRAGLRETLGFFDRVPQGASTEYAERIVAAFGAAAVASALPEFPLVFARHSDLETEPDQPPESYFEAARHWHDTAQGPADLFMPQVPERRIFEAPDGFGPDAPPRRRSRYDSLARIGRFEAKWYLRNHPQALRSRKGALRHYLSEGAAQGLDPGPMFAAGAYALAQGLTPGVNPLLHWQRLGRAMGAAPLPRFSGALEGLEAGRDRVLVCADAADAPCLPPVLARLCAAGQAPVVALFRLRPGADLAPILHQALAIEALVSAPRCPPLAASHQPVVQLRGVIAANRCRRVHLIGAAHEAPLLAAQAEACPVTVHLPSLPDGGTDLRGQLLALAEHFVAGSARVAQWLACPERVTLAADAPDAELLAMPFAPGPDLRIGGLGPLPQALLTEVLGRLAAAGSTARLCPDETDLAHLDVLLCCARPEDAAAKDLAAGALAAMAAGRVLICTDDAVARQWLRNRDTGAEAGAETGLVVPSGSAVALANAILALDAARRQLARLSDGARDHAEWLCACAAPGGLPR